MGKHEKNHLRNRKHIPYGSERKGHYCDCDRYTEDKVSKRAERQKAREMIRKQLKEIP